MQHPHVSVALSLWEATSDSDTDRLAGLLDADIRWSFLASGALSGEARGVEKVIAALARMGELVDDLHSELLDVYASDSGAVLFYRVEASRGPSRLSTDVLMQLDIDRGVVTSARAMPLRSDESSRFWLSQ